MIIKLHTNYCIYKCVEDNTSFKGHSYITLETVIIKYFLYLNNNIKLNIAFLLGPCNQENLPTKKVLIILNSIVLIGR